MKTITTTEVLDLPAGTVMKLSAEQAAARAARLKRVKDGLYEASAPVQFKRGETLGIEGELGRLLQPKVADAAELERQRREAQAKEAAAKEAAAAETRAELARKAWPVLAQLLGEAPEKRRAGYAERLAEILGPEPL